MFKEKRIQIKVETTLEKIFKIKTGASDDLEIKHLSSGEKNLILIFYHFLFEVDKHTFFMIDEPELSLHIDWQAKIIDYFDKYSKDNQILVVTHSPDILQNHREYEINLDKCRV